MSFILDALRKADRDRDLTRIPTLSTVHIPVLTTGRRIGFWVAAGVILAGGGLSVWLWRPSPPMAPPTAMNSRAQTVTTSPASPADPALTPTPARAVEIAPPTSQASVPSNSVAGQQQPTGPQQSTPEAAKIPRSIQALPQKSSGSDLPAASPGGSRGGGGRLTGSSFGEIPPSPTPQTEATPGQPPPVFTVPVPASPVAPQPAPSPGVGRLAPVVVAPSPPAQPAAPATLVDAIAKMRLDLFVYTDVAADRMVTINGRKYSEGDQVDGLYRIESITREGALLSYKDEKLLLRP